jgi:hypothetical protein
MKIYSGIFFLDYHMGQGFALSQPQLHQIKKETGLPGLFWEGF